MDSQSSASRAAGPPAAGDGRGRQDDLVPLILDAMEHCSQAAHRMRSLRLAMPMASAPWPAEAVVEPAVSRSLEPAGDIFVDVENPDDLVGDVLQEMPSAHVAQSSAAPARGFPRVVGGGQVLGLEIGPDEGRTTVMLQRLAFEHTEDTVIEALNDLGFAGKFDAVYVPRNRRKTTNLGYAFVNFVHPVFAAEVFGKCSGRPLGRLPSDRVCKVDYSSKQGPEFLEHFRQVMATHGRSPQIGPAVAAAPVRRMGSSAAFGTDNATACYRSGPPARSFAL